MPTTRAPDTRVRRHASKNRALLLMSLALAAAGITLVVLGLQRDWGFLAVFWSGVLAFIGLGWVIGLLKGGGVASADCPHCGAPMECMHIESARTEQCERCGKWSAGTETMAPLGPDHVAEMPVFSVPLPEHDLRWPTDSGGRQRCPMCAGASTRSVQLKASSALGAAFAALSPISVQRVHVLRAPACTNHDDGIAIDMNSDDHGLVLRFRSWAYFHDFVELNAAPPITAMTPTAQPLAEFLQANPRPIEVRAPLTCPRHDVPVLTAMGWVSRMDFLPSHDWMDDAAQNPVCLNIGQYRERPAKAGHEQARIAWCPACEAGMAELRAARGR